MAVGTARTFILPFWPEWCLERLASWQVTVACLALSSANVPLFGCSHTVPAPSCIHWDVQTLCVRYSAKPLPGTLQIVILHWRRIFFPTEGNPYLCLLELILKFISPFLSCLETKVGPCGGGQHCLSHFLSVLYFLFTKQTLQIRHGNHFITHIEQCTTMWNYNTDI